MNENDDELRRSLRALDPASRLDAAAPEQVARLLEEAMSNQTPDTRTDPAGRRSPLVWIAAAAAVVVIAGASFAVLRGGDEEQAPTAQESTSQAPDSPASEQPAPEPGSNTALVAGDGANAKCMAPNVQVLRTNTLAFDGTVTAIEGDQVTLKTTQWFKGTPTETVTVTAPSEQLQELLVAVDFEVGGRYLVTSYEDAVTLCGFSGAYTADLAKLYQDAYAG
ncbi:hypothetical protein [Nocardioides sp. LHG3406-4]|uniref:hypothetical protein n=1 Tax=Nocardioides sp. LHG3406-4 TaxID=2804575 RepID=UPI003CF4FB6D